MKALSIRQPWAWAILHAGKCIENRGSWHLGSMRYRGPILLHASKGCTNAEYIGAVDSMLDVGVIDHETEVPGLEAIQRGGIVGRATIIDAIARGDQEHRSRLVGFGLYMPWWDAEQNAFVLADVEAVPFVPWPGALGLFKVPDDYATRTPPPGRIARSA